MLAARKRFAYDAMNGLFDRSFSKCRCAPTLSVGVAKVLINAFPSGGARAPTMRGFSLTELIIVLVVMGILATVAIPRLAPTDINLPAQAGQLAGDIRYVQSLAMSRSVRHRL